MSKNKGIVPTDQLAAGDIIDYAARYGSVAPAGSRTMAKGLVYHVIYDSQNNDAVRGFFMLEIVPQSVARKYTDKAFPLESAGTGLPGKESWAIVIEPVQLDNSPQSFLRDAEFTQRYGAISPATEDALEKHMNAYGGEEKLFRHMLDFKGIAPEKWDDLDVYNKPRPEKPGEFDAQKPEKTGKTRKRANRDKGGTMVPDISLVHAVQGLALDERIASAFTQPAALPGIESLRDVWAMIAKEPDRLEKYLAQQPSARVDVSFSEVKDDLFPAIFNGLQQPRSEAVLPVKTLQEAYDLVTQRPHELPQYKYMGPANSELAIEQITGLYETKAGAVISPASALLQIKTAWKKLGDHYLAATRAEPIPDTLKTSDGKPLWVLRKL